MPNVKLAPKELLDVHPLGKAPVITDGPVTIAESGAIVEYLITRYGKDKLGITDVSSQAWLDNLYCGCRLCNYLAKVENELLTVKDSNPQLPTMPKDHLDPYSSTNIYSTKPKPMPHFSYAPLSS